MLPPKLDERSRAKILEELEVLAGQYVPELSDGNDAGFAVLQIFAYMVDEVITRLNKVPEKNLVAFLELFGTEVAPAQPAGTAAQFQLNKGTAKDVAIPREQVATSANEERPVVTFEPGKTVDVKTRFNEVTNEAAESGVDNESGEEALEKASKKFMHNHRAVTREDYEWLAKEASRAVARAKCIPNLSGSEEEESGCVSVIIVPQDMEDRPTASPELLRMVEGYLKSRSPISVSSLTVRSPTYLGICVTAELYVTSIDSASNVKAKAMEELTNFLHPLHRGYRQRRWDFGEMPSNSDIHKLLQKIPDVDHVENLSITVEETRTGKSFVVKHDVSLPTYTLICSGKHQIKVRCVGVR